MGPQKLKSLVIEALAKRGITKPTVDADYGQKPQVVVAKVSFELSVSTDSQYFEDVDDEAITAIVDRTVSEALGFVENKSDAESDEIKLEVGASGSQPLGAGKRRGRPRKQGPVADEAEQGSRMLAVAGEEVQ